MGLLAWAVTGGSTPDPHEDLDRAASLLSERFSDWRRRVERASARMVVLGGRGSEDPAGAFVEAERIVAEESVHGVAVIDWKDRARLWAGRTFDVNPEENLFYVGQGDDVVEVLEHPAHRVLVAARPAGDEIAVAFFVFDESFPQRRDLAGEVAAETGLDRIILRYGLGTVPAGREEALDRPYKRLVINDLVHASFLGRSADEVEEIRRRQDSLRWRTFFFALGVAAGVALWVLLGRRLPPTSLLRALLALILLAAGRVLLLVLDLPVLPHFLVESDVHPLWAGPGDVALSAAVILVGAILVGRAALHARPGMATRVLTVIGVGGTFFLPSIYDALVRMLTRRPDGVILFDPLQVEPGLGAALLLMALCLLTGALFLAAHAAWLWARTTHRLLIPAPYLAIAVGLLPWKGLVVAAGCALASAGLRRGRSQPEKAAAVVFLAVLTSFPLLYVAEREEFVRNVAGRAHDLLSRSRRPQVEARLEEAVRAATDPVQGVDWTVADRIARGANPKHLAFLLWSASEWNTDDPCAVQVWDPSGNLLSAFDFDSPPAQLLPGPPEEPREGHFVLVGPHERLHFYARDFLLRTLGDGRVVGVARFLVPDRWDVLLTDLRPSMFSGPADLLRRGASPPLLLAELDPEGLPGRTSKRLKADLARPDRELLDAALEHGYTSRRLSFAGRDARLVVAAAHYSYAALVFEESLLEQGGFAFAKVLLTYSAVCLLFVLGVVAARRMRVVLLFRHRVALFLILLSVPPVLLLAAYDTRVAEARYEEEISERLERRIDLAETLLGKLPSPDEADNDWCTNFAADHLMDVNIYRGQELVATSRPGVWDTGLLGRRLASKPYLELILNSRTDYGGQEYFARGADLRAAYRRLEPARMQETPFVLAAPALDDRRVLERRETESNALLLAVYLMTATVTIFVALLLARSLTRPVQQLQEATSRVSAGELGDALPEGRQDEFGDLVRAFNRMTKDIQETQDLRVRVEKAAAWREMARQIAHEIKNPLTPIKLTVQNLLASHETDPVAFREEFATGAKLILDQIDALHRIAGDFSAYARFPMREPGPLDVNELLEEVAAFYKAAGGAPVDVEPAPEPLVVEADRDELRRALINLVTNSRQAGATRVTLGATARDASVALTVRDDGSGMATEHVDRVWEPSFTTKSAGAGLGMPIVKRVVDDHGGTIQIDSAPGRGMRVVIRLPRR